MMASHQILFSETIAGMKKAIKRKAYDSDSDCEIESYTNRGHKLKKQARFAHKGQLVPTAGPSAYREVVEYAGTRRAIIHRNPPLMDPDGYEIDSDDDDSQVEEAILSAAELNPYANIRLEQVLAPLTASIDLPTHPLLSKPFTSHTLTELVSQSRDIMQKENKSLWRVRHLWTSLCGDGTWMPCEVMVGPNDIDFYSDELTARHLRSVLGTNLGKAASPAAVDSEVQTENPPDDSSNQTGRKDDTDVPMRDADPPNGTGASQKPDRGGGPNKTDDDQGARPDQRQADEDTDMVNGDGGKDSEEQPLPSGTKQKHDAATPLIQIVRAQSAPELAGHAKEQDKGPLSALGDVEESFIHPMFLPPPGAKPDRNLGLPDREAENIRRLLALYVQKQEEVCRGAIRLHQGLLKAERLRKDVLHWAKAEAHCGPNRDMSDGEDWYDKEEWGLTEDLKKGQDEEEEDTTTTGKKTRNRR